MIIKFIYRILNSLNEKLKAILFFFIGTFNKATQTRERLYRVKPYVIRKNTIVDICIFPKRYRENLRIKNVYLTNVLSNPSTSCFICNVSIYDIKTHNYKKNPFGATAIHMHHLIIPHQFTNAIDLKKLNKFLHIIFKYQKNVKDKNKKINDEDTSTSRLKAIKSKEELDTFIDQHPANYIPLCDVHHIKSYFGVHKLTFSSWIIQKFFTDEYIKHLIAEVNDYDKVDRIRNSNKKNGNSDKKILG